MSPNRDPLKGLKLGVGPLSGKIYLARVNAKGLALAKREITEEALGVVAQYMQHAGPAGCSITFEAKLGAGDFKACQLICRPLEDSKRKRKLSNSRTREPHVKTPSPHRSPKRRRPSRPKAAQ